MGRAVVNPTVLLLCALVIQDMLASCSRRRLWWTVLLGTALLLEALSASATTKNGVVVTPAASASFWGWLGRKGGSDRKAMAEASSMTRDACEAMVVREPRRGRVVTFKAKGKRSIKLRGVYMPRHS